ncbi:MAG: DNA-processing protein DprA [Clostridia bacterium]|nr:DNA-processing protein DprA [Clostridia bacterium]
MEEKACLALCAKLFLNEGVKPLEAREWSALSENLRGKGISSSAILGWGLNDFINNLGADGQFAERLFKLCSRAGRVFGKCKEYERAGICAVTADDGEYPAKLKDILGATKPPVLFCAGDLSLLKGEFAGYVGSREAQTEDISFARFAVQKTVERGYGVVSGGARGVDTACEEEALALGGAVAEFPSDAMMKKLKNQKISRAVNGGKMLLLSLAPPEAGFNLGVAMMRNRYIYVQSEGTVVIRSDYNKGGTWAGATDCLKHGWCKLMCRKRTGYAGNTALIERGAIPIDFSFDGDISAIERTEPPEQLSLFK